MVDVPPPPSPLGPRVVAIGGDSRFALEQVLRTLPERAGFTCVVAYTGAGEFLPSAKLASPLPALPIEPGVAALPDRVLVVPPGHDAVFGGQTFELVAHDAEPHAPLDRLFRSLADTLGRTATCVVLSGRGVDGAIGLKRVKEAGGLTIAQSPSEAEDPTMPLAAIATGLVDLVLAAQDIGPRIASVDPFAGELIEDERRARDPVADALRDVLTLLRIRTGHDFSQYKRPTLYRRIARRMQVCQCDTIGDYHRYLREHPLELGNLLRDFLISVTNFFRDPDAFDTLATRVIPQLFANKGPQDQVRVWVAGCATGEEAYSIGMLLLEHASTLADPPTIQIFATDIDEDSLAEARTGRYSEAISVDVSPERLVRFFVREGRQYRVVKTLREIVLFSPHNMLRDPPFSRLDLVSSRNLLIYLNREAQDRVLAVFHFGLRADGFLFLGSSEAVEGAAVQFSPLDAKARVFQRRATVPVPGVSSLISATRWQPRPPAESRADERPIASFGELHHRLVEHYAPPSVIVNDELDIVHMSENAKAFLSVGAGEPTRQLLNLVRPGLRLDLRAALYAARHPGTRSDARTVRFDDEGKTRQVSLRVRGVEIPTIGNGLWLVMFDELAAAPAEPMPAPDEAEQRAYAIEPVVRQLEEELGHTRHQLRDTIEQYETSAEELKAANEELHAINEELSAASEELETSKEELQSVNEELTSLNHELKSNVDEMGQANSDLQNLMTSTDIAVLFLDRALTIKRFTRRVGDLFNIIPSDVGRPFAHLTHRLDIDDLPRSAAEVLEHLRAVERAVTSRDGRRFLARLLPYRSIDDRIEGVVLTFVDITELATAQGALLQREGELRASEERFRLAFTVAPMIATSQDAAYTYLWAFVLGRELGAGTSFDDLLSATEAQRLAAAKRIAVREQATQRLELELRIDDELQMFDVRIEPTLASGACVGLTTVGFDISASKRAELMLRDGDRRKDEFLATLSHELRNPLTPLRLALDMLKLASGDPDKTDKARAIMDRQVDQLIGLVDEMLDLSRITQGKIEILRDPLDLRDVIAAAVEDTRGIRVASRHKLVLDLGDEPLNVVGESSRLVQVFVNLLTNAVKYTPVGGDITVTARRDPARGRLLVSVRDSGIGLAPEQLRDIFELFVQSRDARGRSRGGLGIGLNLVRRFVEMHGGNVTATSDGVGSGSTFVVDLPHAV